MTNIFKQFILVILMFFSLVSVSSAENLQVYSDKKNGFQIAYPNNWIKKLNSRNYNVLFHNKAENVVLGVLVKKNPGKLSAGKNLEVLEQSIKAANIAEVRSAAKEKLKAVGADDSSLGVYQVNGKKGPIVMKYSVFTKGALVFVIIQTIQAGEAFELYGDLLDQMAGSFKIK